jgi:hypothetical protein
VVLLVGLRRGIREGDDVDGENEGIGGVGFTGCFDGRFDLVDSYVGSIVGSTLGSIDG